MPRPQVLGPPARYTALREGVGDAYGLSLLLTQVRRRPGKAGWGPRLVGWGTATSKGGMHLAAPSAECATARQPRPCYRCVHLHPVMVSSSACTQSVAHGWSLVPLATRRTAPAGESDSAIANAWGWVAGNQQHGVARPSGATGPAPAVPGIQNSGPTHWQSRWETTHPAVRRRQQDWDHPVCDDWVRALDDAVARSVDAPILVAHSLGLPGGGALGGALGAAGACRLAGRGARPGRPGLSTGSAGLRLVAAGLAGGAASPWSAAATTRMRRPPSRSAVWRAGGPSTWPGRPRPPQCGQWFGGLARGLGTRRGVAPRVIRPGPAALRRCAASRCAAPAQGPNARWG